MTVKVKRVAIFVERMDRALNFYRTLGLEIPASADEEHHVEVEQNGFRLAFDTWEMAEGILGGSGKPTGHRMELAFQFDGREALDESYRRLTAQGYTGYLAPQDTPWGERYAIVKDPDGNLVSMVA